MSRLATADAWGIPSMPLASLHRTGWGSYGDVQSAGQALSYSTAGASTAVGAGVAAGLIPAAAVPFIGPAIAGAALLAAYLIKNSGCGQTCIQTSQWANQAQDALVQNINAYFALPAPRSPENQQLALQTFDQIWAQLVKMCGDPQWGDAGKRCISDRERGACKWHATENSQWPGGVQLGECFNWFAAFRDPIANDRNVGSASVLDSAIFGGGESSGSLLPALAIAGLIVAAVAL